MGKLERTLERVRRNNQTAKYDDVYYVCCKHFGDPRQTGGSHAVFKTPWSGDPRVNIQRNKDGTAKAYQVRQVLAAIEQYEEEGREHVS